MKVLQTFLVVFVGSHLVSAMAHGEGGGDGLYDSNDYVISLFASNLKNEVYNKEHASLVEFYNSYCGFCRRFAPTWKRLAEDFLGWQNLVIVAAIDCARDENSDICRDFEIMAYPTIRFFEPHYTDGPQKIGIPLKGHSQDDLTNQLVQHIQDAEKPPKNWPNFAIFNETDNSKIFDKNENIKFAFIVNDNDVTSKIGEQVLMDFFTVAEIAVRRSQCNTTNGVTAIDAKSKSAIKLPVSEFSRHEVTTAIKDFLKTHGIIVAEPTTRAPVKITTTEQSIDEIMRQKQDEAIDKKVKEMKNVVFQADLEMALRFALFEEIARFKTIDGERLLALQRFMNVLVRYFPFGDNGMKFLKEIRQYVVNAETEISGENFSNYMHKLETERRVFSVDRWVGCHSNLKNFRKYPCGLWAMFHYLTVQAAELEISTDPLEVLQAMHGYIKYYFGCTHCSEHFQQMAARSKIWNVTSKDDAVLWLWSSHNEVNNRLQGDSTEDPEYPKIQFPAEDACQECRKKAITNNHNHKRYGSPSGGKDGIEWDLVKILEFLKSMYGYDRRNFLGLSDERMTPVAQAFIADGSSRSFGNILSEMDMRMGALLYILCIVILVVAVKLVVKRGYKKKLYVHDLLGKV